VLGERIRLKNTLVEYVFIPRQIFPSGTVLLVSTVVMSAKKLPGKTKLPKVSTYMVARFRT